MNLRKLAKGQPCMVRLAGVCNGNPETTVLAHFRLIGSSGMGLKSPDFMAAWACSDCHDAIDRRRHTAFLARDEVRLAHLEGVMRTQCELHRLGLVHFKSEALETQR